MACLTYKPSEIPFRGTAYERKKLLTIQNQRFMKAWKKALQQIGFYKEKFSDFETYMNGMAE